MRSVQTSKASRKEIECLRKFLFLADGHSSNSRQIALRFVPGTIIDGQPKYGAYQHYSVAKIGTVTKIPQTVGFTEASVVPAVFITALVTLCAGPGRGLGLPLPSLNPKPSGKVIVVWSASTGVGLQALQLAKAAGVTTIATASPHNFDLIKSAGAAEVLDYRSPSIVKDVARAVEATGEQFAGVVDCISIFEQSIPACIDVLQHFGGGKLGVMVPHIPYDFPKNVEAIRINITELDDLVHPFFKDFITPALEKEVLKCLPEPLVVGKGLESLQKGLDKMREGVSARKVVVELT
jgi:NADPH:quinone reductase-like Zn-dependent oxidoreductase